MIRMHLSAPLSISPSTIFPLVKTTSFMHSRNLLNARSRNIKLVPCASKDISSFVAKPHPFCCEVGFHIQLQLKIQCEKWEIDSLRPLPIIQRDKGTFNESPFSGQNAGLAKWQNASTSTLELSLIRLLSLIFSLLFSPFLQRGCKTWKIGGIREGEMTVHLRFLGTSAIERRL